MGWGRPQISRKDGSPNYYSYPPPLSVLPPPPPPPGSRISPAVLFIIVILAFLFFISGVLHLLVRLLTKRSSSSSSSNGYPEMSTSEALQRQLQQLFHLHDSGLDQSLIDSLPAFRYSEVVGPKQPFDCAVCLSEFSDDDNLRLLPTCSHAFHISCIDTWLLSNSTCPICRAALFAPGFPMENPVFEYDDDYPDEQDRRAEIEEGSRDHKGVLQVKLGKFRKFDNGCEEPRFEEASNSNFDARRCYSMGSYQYVVGNTNLRVALCPDQNQRPNKVAKDSNSPVGGTGDSEGNKISNISRGDSYSVSKIWLWQKKGGLPSSSWDARIDLPSFNSELPWIDRKPNV